SWPLRAVGLPGTGAMRTTRLRQRFPDELRFRTRTDGRCPDRRRRTPVPGTARVLRRPQLCRARARNGLGPRPRAAVLLLQARRCRGAGCTGYDPVAAIPGADARFSLRA